VYVNLAIAYTQSGKYGQAIQNWTKAAELKPDSSNALNNLAWLLATVDDANIRDANKAIELAQRACELTENKEPSFLDTLAAAYAAAGRFDDAKATAEKAMNVAKTSRQENLTPEIERRLQLYKEGRQYIQR
jgi:Flp pilus assembly protein TadD